VSAEPSVEYTEVKHVVVVAADEYADPMEMTDGWRMQPESVKITYTMRSAMGDTDWQHHVEVSGYWLPLAGRVQPGTAVLVPWHADHFAPWLRDLIEEHRPKWRPAMPPPRGTTP
jgi:hypothetical protein